MNPPPRLGGLPAAVLLLCCAAWGLNQVAIKVSLAGIPPLRGAGLRSLVAALLLWIWCALRGEPVLRRDGSGGYGLLIGLMFASEFVFIYGGLVFTTASRSVVFLYTAPFLVALAAHVLIPGERLTRGRTAGLALAFAGLCLAFWDSVHLPSRRELLGDALELVGGVLWAATTVVVKMGGPVPLTARRKLLYQLGVSGVVLVAASALAGEPGLVAPGAAVLGAFAYQAVVVAFASYLVWFWLLERYPASSLAAFSFWTPLFGVLAGWLLLGDPLTANLAVAAGLVALGIYLVNRRPGGDKGPSASLSSSTARST